MCHTNQFLFYKENGTLTLSICIVLNFYALRENFVCVCVCQFSMDPLHFTCVPYWAYQILYFWINNLHSVSDCEK